MVISSPVIILSTIPIFIVLVVLGGVSWRRPWCLSSAAHVGQVVVAVVIVVVVVVVDGGCDNVVYGVDVVIGSGKRGCVGEMGSVESVRADVRRVE